MLDSAPDIVRAIEHLHRLVSLRHLLEHASIVRFAVQRFLKTCERVCRVAAFPEFFTFSQQLINDGWSAVKSPRRPAERLAAPPLPLALMRKPTKPLDARAIVARNCLCRDAVRSRPADIIRCRKEDLGYGENYNAHPGRRESLDRFE